MEGKGLTSWLEWRKGCHEMSILETEPPAGRSERGKSPSNDFISPAGGSVSTEFASLLLAEYQSVCCDLSRQLRKNFNVHSDESKRLMLKASALWQVAEMYGIPLSKAYASS